MKLFARLFADDNRPTRPVRFVPRPGAVASVYAVARIYTETEREAALSWRWACFCGYARGSAPTIAERNVAVAALGAAMAWRIAGAIQQSMANGVQS
jgi:hypothetical protein